MDRVKRVNNSSFWDIDISILPSTYDFTEIGPPQIFYGKILSQPIIEILTLINLALITTKNYPYQH